MKLKKVNKVLSITLASAMLFSSVPVNTFADEAESELARGNLFCNLEL